MENKDRESREGFPKSPANVSCLASLPPDGKRADEVRGGPAQAGLPFEPDATLLIESMGAGWWDQDFHTGKVRRSPRWMTMLGYEPREIPETLDAWEELLHPDDLPQARWIAKRHEEGELPEFKVLHRMRCKDGRWKLILNCGRIVRRDPQGRPLRAVGTHIDLTLSEPFASGTLKLADFLEASGAETRASANVLAVCAGCKRVRTGGENWLPFDVFLLKYTRIRCTHGLCPECLTRLYPEFSISSCSGSVRDDQAHNPTGNDDR